MIGDSLSLEELKKLSHFDRLRRGYFDNIPTNLGLIGFTLSIHLFSVSSVNVAFGIAVALYCGGIFLKMKFIEKDDIELEHLEKEKNKAASSSTVGRRK